MTSVAALALPLLLASPALADANPNSYGSWNEPAPGAPRAWQGGHALNPYSTFNLLNGNTLTALGLVSIDPVGPPLTFALYHNSASANADESGAAGQGFDLGRGWSTSYSGRVVFDGGDPNTALVIEDDGSRNEFTKLAGVWTPPSGVHDRLLYDDTTDPNHPVWVLTRPSQWKRVFDDAGLLIAEQDSAGNAVTLVRDSGNGDRITEIHSAAHGLDDVSGTITHRLTLAYDDDQLDYIDDVIGRRWSFEYNEAGRMVELHYPSDAWIDPSFSEFGYHGASGRIRFLHERREADCPTCPDLLWTYQYSSGILNKVIDPFQSADPNDPNSAYEQSAGGTSITGAGGTTNIRTITDRRGYNWVYRYDDANDRLKKAVDPLSGEREFAWDGDWNLTGYTDELDHTWTLTYNPIGGLETVASPLDTGDPNQPQKWTLAWHAVGGAGANFYQLRKVTDPAGKWIAYRYEDPNDETGTDDATLVVKVIEMPAGQSDPNSVTTLEYSTAANAKGQLTLVTDANGVKTQFGYDKWGYSASLLEGTWDETNESKVPVSQSSGNDAAGRTTDSEEGGACGTAGYDVDDNLEGAGCCLALGGGHWTRLGVAGAPQYDMPEGSGVTLERDPLGLLLKAPVDLPQIIGTSFGWHRQYEFAYDEVRRLTSATRTMDPNSPHELNREFGVDEYDPDDRPLSITGPDGQSLTYVWDELGRLESIDRSGGSVELCADLTYDAAGRNTVIDYGNGAKVTREFDEVNRLTKILHEDDAGADLSEIRYKWTINNWVEKRVEITPGGMVAVEFTYDSRGRLTREKRIDDPNGTPATLYDLTYAYDPLGNRKTKADAVAQTRVDYFYDTDPNATFGDYITKNNRLQSYRLYDTSGQGDDLVRTVSYVYLQTGDVSNIIIKDENATGDPNDANWNYELAFYYLRSKQLDFVLWGRWKLDAEDEVVYQADRAMQFRFDSARGRWLAAGLDPPTTLATESYPNSGWALADDMLFTDYLGDLPYNDGVLDQSTYAHSDATRYLGLAAEKDVSSGAETYYHGDLIDSTVAATDAEGELASWGEDDARLAYTAFGEVLTAGEPNDGGGAPGGSAPEGAPRYQYAGGYGYESGLLTLQGADTTLPPITLQHLGYRWYQPDSGRFVQRDPIGLIGGPNIYAYTNNAPVRATDPQGLTTIHPRDWWEQMRRHNRAIARWLRELRKTTPLTRAEALGRLRAALAARNATYLGRFGPWMIAAICVQYGIVEPVVAAGDEWNEKTKGVEGLVNRRRIGRMGGFSPAESDDLWGY